MRILLISTNRNKLMYPVPVGLAYLIGPLQAKGYKVAILDLMFSTNPLSDINNIIDTYQPEIIGYSIRNLDNQDMLNSISPLPEIKEYVKIARKRRIISVLGGIAFSTLPKEILEYMQADYGIAGQGERSFPLLIQAINDKTTLRNIPGLVWWEDGTIIMNPLVKDGYTKGVIPDWSVFDLSKYRGKIEGLCIVTQTGCPNNCIYCNHRHLFGDEYKSRPIKDIIEDIRIIRKIKKIRLFHFPYLFNGSLDWAKELFEAIIKEKGKIYFGTTIIPMPNSYDNEFFKLYKRAGGMFFLLGTESLSQAILHSYKKPFAVDDIVKIAELGSQNGMQIMLELMFGGPGESAETVKESMNLLPKIKAADVIYTTGVRILPNTEIFNIAQREGIVQNISQLLFPKYYISKFLDVEWANHYIKSCLENLRPNLRNLVRIR